MAAHNDVENVATAKRFIEEVFNEDNLFLADEICAPDIVCSEPPSAGGVVTNGTEELKQYLVAIRTAFDYKIIIDEISAGDNKVTARWTFNATHHGEFLGVAATGKKVINKGIFILTFAQGKIVDSYSMWDTLNLWWELGVDPPQPS